ncbi:galactokinase [Xylanibacillus composti]|nr:galactokinase [Xylanibacillus composti]MDT9724964.1 galactokinase [Xylanibacillus composti]
MDRHRQTLTAAFHEAFDNAGKGEGGLRFFFAPGRVNMIGEHTDYNGGYVFPAALTFGTWVVARKRPDRKLRFASLNFPSIHECDLDQLVFAEHDRWANYPKAVLAHLQKHGYDSSGYDLLYAGNIPGSGLSSSASIQLVTAYGIMRSEGREVDPVKLALIAQESENQFMGVNCGIMDQFTVAMGKEEHAILLKCDTLDYELVPFRLSGYKVLIANTNKSRGLVDSAYNERRAQCEQAVADLRASFPDLKVLGELNAEQLKTHMHVIGDSIVRKRAAHVIEENDRVLASVKALKRNDLQQFGQLMNASHASLRDLYEVSCHELDVLVEEALQVEGVLGSRMTGAGFGGCTVSIVEETQVDTFIERVGAAYRERTDYEAEFYVADIGNGVHEKEEE